MRKFLVLVILIMTGTVWANINTDLSPKEAISYIEGELFKKGLKDLKVTCGGVIDSKEHNIFIELGAKGRSIQEGYDIIYESALIIGKLDMETKEPHFRINTLSFMKNGKLACWIHADYCQRAIWDHRIKSSSEREAYILSNMHYER